MISLILIWVSIVDKSGKGVRERGIMVGKERRERGEREKHQRDIL